MPRVAHAGPGLSRQSVRDLNDVTSGAGPARWAAPIVLNDLQNDSSPSEHDDVFPPCRV